MLTDTSLLAHLEAVERLFGVDVSELSVVPATKPGDVVYRELASDEGEKRYVVRRLGGGRGAIAWT